MMLKNWRRQAQDRELFLALAASLDMQSQSVYFALLHKRVPHSGTRDRRWLYSGSSLKGEFPSNTEFSTVRLFRSSQSKARGRCAANAANGPQSAMALPAVL